MAYSCNGVSRANYFSNPLVTFKSNPTGTETENCALAISENMADISLFRDGTCVGTDGSCTSTAEGCYGTCTNGLCGFEYCPGTWFGYAGNGFCAAALNNAECGFDGGDSCECDCVTNANQCGINGYNCLDPRSACFDGACDVDGDCDTGEICCPTKKICEVPLAGTNPAACGDPHMTGFLGQKFDFTGEDGGWYCLIKDDNMQVSMRVSSPVPSLPEITYITGLAVLTADLDGAEHSIVIEAKDPHNLESSCPAKVPSCLADGSLAVTIDGGQALLAPGTIRLGSGVDVSAVNLPRACRSFGFEQYWEKKKLERGLIGRRLHGSSVGMGEWILGDPTATNMEECRDYVGRVEMEAGGVFVHQSEHASFQIVTPGTTLRLSHGRLHQVAMRDPTDSFDLPDHLTWQMNFAVDHNKVSRDAVGILGETLVPTLDDSGRPIMQGMASIRGLQEDYRVEGPLGTGFVQGGSRGD